MRTRRVWGLFLVSLLFAVPHVPAQSASLVGCYDTNGKIGILTLLRKFTEYTFANELNTKLSVPTSNVIGKHWWGFIPASAVYNASLVIGIPIPKAPRSAGSSQSKILPLSVTIITLISLSGLIIIISICVLYHKNRCLSK